MIYNLHSLGWASFQNLCGTVLREVWGQTYQTFSDSKDAGRDGAFWGKWKPTQGEEMSGSFVVQCKFTAQADSVLQASQLSGELDKARRLAQKGLARNYVLMTNASLRAPVEAELREAFTAIPGIEHFVAFGGEWITEQIRESQKLRPLVPRVYGLGDLTEILDERVYEQAREIMSWLGDELERFVVTDAHYKSVRALNEKKFVFLLGDPGSGKSTIAAALALAAADGWGSRVIKVRHADEFVSHWNAHESNQLFWADDVFGQTQYEREQARDWNSALPQLSAALRKGARMIFTSRSYIYKAACEDLKHSMFPLLQQAQVVIEVEKLTQREREQILYNHLRLGDQPIEFLSQLKPFLSQVAAHPGFLPVIASRLAMPFFTDKVTPTLEGVIDFIEKSEQYLVDVIMEMGDAHKAAIGSVFMKGGTLPAPLDFNEEEKHAIEVMNSNVGEVRKSLAHLEGSLLVREIEGGETVLRFKHPTVRDAYAGIISNDPNLIDIYLSGTRVESIIEEVSCGDMEIEGVKLIVSPALFPLMLKRLKELKKDKVGKRRLVSFLSSRCTVDFLRDFLKEEPNFIASLKFSSWLVYSREAELFATLHKHQLLPEGQRKRFVKFASNAAVTVPEWRFMRFARPLFRPGELRSLRAVMRRDVTAKNLKWRTNWFKEIWDKDKKQEPDDLFWSWSREISAMANEFYENRAICARFESAEKRVGKMITELSKEWEDKSSVLDGSKEMTNPKSERSLFDDVDEL